MHDLKINKSTRVNLLGKERFYPGSKKTAALILHGWTGWPRDMEYLGKRINQDTNYTVFIPRLPGHGTTASDFKASNARDWLRKAYDSFLKLKSQYTVVHVAGLSMGGLLSILIAARFEVKKLILIAPALYTYNKKLPLAHLLRYFMPEIKQDNNENLTDSDFDLPEERVQNKNYWTKTYTAQAAELHKLMLLARRKLNQVSADTLVASSQKDDTVPLKAAYKIKEKARGNITMKIFKDSPHVINNGPEKKECANLIIDFLQGN